MQLRKQAYGSDKAPARQKMARFANIDQDKFRQKGIDGQIQGAGVDLTALKSRNLFQLQRTLGNRAANQLLSGTLQRQPPQKKSNTDLPDDLKAGIESLSGMPMDDVKVHYNSSEPDQMHAWAYTQGTDIHVGPGQERLLPHEAWHVVQQKQGRVAPTTALKGEQVNMDARLELEADLMGRRALGRPGEQSADTSSPVHDRRANSQTRAALPGRRVVSFN